MINNRQFRTEELLKSAAGLPEIDPKLRKRVLRAAREAQRERTLRRRVQWALGSSAAAIVLAAVYGALTPPEHPTGQYAPGVMGRPAPTMPSRPEAPNADASKHDEPRNKARVR
jgi:hypothetical protein